jgi:hypothetical protein
VASKWSNRFEIKPGRWVYVPTPETRLEGAEIKRKVSALWQPPPYYYHLHKGGHVTAIKSHLDNSHFIRCDIRDFFGSISKTRITRGLKPLVSYPTARSWASCSTVQSPGHIGSAHIPYGFIQSQLLASLCLYRSALGKLLHRIHDKQGLIVSVYVDDVIVSARDARVLSEVYAKIHAAAERSKLDLNLEKCVSPSLQVSAFNILISEDAMSIEPVRLAAFAAALGVATTDARRKGILNYVKSVCPAQLGLLDS